MPMSAMALAPLPEVTANDLPDEAWPGSVFSWLAGTLDGAILQAMHLAVGALMMPRAEDLPALRRSAAPFVAGPLVAEPGRYFDFIGASGPLVEEESRFQRRVAGGTVVARRFATNYRPAAAQPGGEPAAADDRLLVEHWTCEPRRPLGTAIALHGFTMGTPRIDAFALFAGDFFRRGIDVALVTLPFHGKRTPRTARFSGEHFAVPDVGRMNAAVRQAVYEVDALAGWLRQRTGAPVGLIGMSLGGYITALMAGLSDALAFAVPMVPPACIGDLAWRFFSRSRHHDNDGAFSLDELRLAYRVHSPLTYPLALPRPRAFIVAGRADQIVPAAHPHALWRHWGEPRIHWFSGSHQAPFGRGHLIRAVLDHAERCCRQ
jgi:dienelactone hydrolase